jgi:hypothetical protein
MDLQSALQVTSTTEQPSQVPEESVKESYHPQKKPVTQAVEGWCWKQGGKRANWKKRWFILLRNRLYYCELNGSPPINFILIEEGTVIEAQKERTYGTRSRMLAHFA